MRQAQSDEEIKQIKQRKQDIASLKVSTQDKQRLHKRREIIISMKFIRKLGKKLRDELEKQGKEIRKFQKSQSIRLKKLQRAESKLQRKQSYQNNLFTGLMTKESLQIQKNATHFAPGMRGKQNSSTSLGNFDSKNIYRKT